MKLEHCKRNEFGKSDTPENTIKRLDKAIGSLYEYDYHEQKIAEHLHWSALLIDELEFRSMGKGISPLMCKAGALAEAAEMLAANKVERLPGYCTGHQDQMDDKLEIEDLLSHIKTATPETIKRIKLLDTAQYWVDGFSLINNRTVKVPIEYVRQISGPSGLAAGNTKEEALEHSMCEIFERRAHIATLKQRIVLPTIDIDTIESPIIHEHIDFVKSKGIEVIIKDLSFGGELPCVGAYFNDQNIPEEFQFHHFFKVGSTFNKEEALIRCFTEYTQGRRLDEFIQGSEEEQHKVLNSDFRNLGCMNDNDDNFLSAFMFGMIPYKNADFLKEGDIIPFDKGVSYPDILEDINHALDLYRKLGKDCIVIDFTDPKIGFPVIHVIVPGYSDVLPYHPSSSRVLFETVTRPQVLHSYREIKFEN